MCDTMLTWTLKRMENCWFKYLINILAQMNESQTKPKSPRIWKKKLGLLGLRQNQIAHFSPRKMIILQPFCTTSMQPRHISGTHMHRSHQCVVVVWKLCKKGCIRITPFLPTINHRKMFVAQPTYTTPTQ
jgi:hypothetical protein